MVRNGVNPFSSANRGRSEKEFLGIGLRTVWMFVCFALGASNTENGLFLLFSVCLFVFKYVCVWKYGGLLFQKQGMGSDHVLKIKKLAMFLGL